MKYFKINFSLSSKIRGNNNYIKDYKLKIPSIGKLYWEIPEFIGNVCNKEIDFEPFLLDIELFSNSKLNDLIMDGGPISSKLVVSNKLKLILEKSRKRGMQFFNINILKKNEIFSNYWILNMYELNQEFINFKQSKIIYEKKDDDFNQTYSIKNIELEISDYDEFNLFIEKAKDKLEVVTIEEVAIKDIVDEDFFALKYVSGGLGYYVSEKLKEEIEESGCTGIEFQPSHLSLNEWLHSEREKVYGKA